MAIDNLTFAMHVEEQRKKLIEALNQNGIQTSKNESLSGAVYKAEQFSQQAPALNTGYLVKYFDIDGTVLKEEYVGHNGTPTPPTPSYDSEYLTFVKWVDLPDVITDDTYALAVYETTTNDTYLFIDVNETYYTGLLVTLNIAGSNLTIDWGDGIVDSNLSHTYSTSGSYVIKITGVFTQSSNIIGPKDNTSNTTTRHSLTKCYYSKDVTVYGNKTLFFDFARLKNLILPSSTKVYLGSTGTRYMSNLRTLYLKEEDKVGSYPFGSCVRLKKTNALITEDKSDINGLYSLEEIKIAPSDSQISGNEMSKMPLLKRIVVTGDITGFPSNASTVETITIEEGVTIVPNISYRTLKNINFSTTVTEIRTIYSSVAMKKLKLPPNLKTIANIAELYNLEEIEIPSTLEGAFPSFAYCYSIKKLTIPPLITSIKSEFLGSGAHYSLEELTVLCAVVPTVNSFSLNQDTIIWVNDNIIDELKVATNWSKHADKMRPLSEKPIE